MTDPDPIRDYDGLMAELAATAELYARERADTDGRYDRETAAVRAERDAAAAEVANAQHWVSAARRLVDQVNDEVDNAWSRALAALPRPMAARFRPSMPRPRPPVPADETRNRAEVAHRVGALVDAAQHLVFDVEQSPPLSRRALPLFALVGALTAGLAFAGAHGLLVLGVHRPGPVGLVLAAIGRIAVFASPLTGLAPTKWYADRTGARLDLWSVVAIVAAGIAALTSLSLLLR